LLFRKEIISGFVNLPVHIIFEKFLCESMFDTITAIHEQPSPEPAAAQ